MTDDIVTRLREHQNPWYPLDEAADEIEQLRSMLRHVLGNNAFDPDDDCPQCRQIMVRYGNIIWHTPIPDSEQDKAQPMIFQQERDA